MPSVVEIANLALFSVGSRSSIAALNENSSEARAVNRQWPTAVDEVLNAAHWNFARKQFPLTLLKAALGTPENPSDATQVPLQPWLYEYAYPSDCVQARYVLPLFTSTGVSTSIFGPDFQQVASYPEAGTIRFLVATDTDENGNDIKVILTNQPQAVLVYTKRVTDALLFDAPFARALANYLGACICLGINGDKQMASNAFRVADMTTKNARASNGNEGITVIDTLPDWIAERGYAPVNGCNNGGFVAAPIDLSYIS